MTPEWADRVVSRYRQDWLPVVSDTYYLTNKLYLLSKQSLHDVRESFDDEQFKKAVDIKALPIFEKTRNLFIDKGRKNGIKPKIKAVDPSVKKDKEQDIFRLQNRQSYERLVNEQRSKIGLPPYKMPSDNFNGNIDEFDEMGLDPNSPSDVEFFMKTMYKLNYQALAQDIVKSYMNLSKIEDDIPRQINDALSVKAICKQDYVSQLTGQVKHVYLQPNQTYFIPGQNRDATDSPVKGWYMPITVKQLLDQLGSAFDFETQWRELIYGINYTNNMQFDGFIRGGVTYCCYDLRYYEENPDMKMPDFNFLNWSNCYNYKVQFGYIEWEQFCTHIEKRNTKTGQRFQADHAFKPTKKSQYEREEYGYFKMLSANFLATGFNSQRLYGFGPLYHQQTKGQYDEYCSGSISIIREEGISAVDIAKPYIDLANFAYYKMLWAIRRSKPDVWDFSYESIREVAKKMVPQTESLSTPQSANAFENSVMNLLEMFQKKLIMLHTYPIEDGRIIGGGGTPHVKIPGALDGLAVQLQEVTITWAEGQILDKLGTAGLASAQQPNPKDGLKISQIFLQQSNAATGYILELVQKAWEHTAKICLQYTQDICNFKSSVAYKFLKDMVGKDVIDSIDSLDNVAAHRLGIFITSFDTTVQKEKVDQQAEIALANGTLTYAQYLLIINIEDPTVAAVKFAYLDERKRKQDKQDAMEIEQMKQQTILMQHKAKMEEIQLQGQFQLQGDQINAQATIKGKEFDYRGKVDTKQMTINSDGQKQAQKAQAEKDILVAKSNIEAQQPLE